LLKIIEIHVHAYKPTTCQSWRVFVTQGKAFFPARPIEVWQRR